MSRATKRKHVWGELGELRLLQPGQQIVRIATSRGNNLHEAQTADGSSFLVSMPTKFRKNVWVKRGDYVLVEPIQEGDKVKAEMVAVLTPAYIKFLKSEDAWPQGFTEGTQEEQDSLLLENPNRPQLQRRDSSSDSNSDSEKSTSG